MKEQVLVPKLVVHESPNKCGIAHKTAIGEKPSKGLVMPGQFFGVL